MSEVVNLAEYRLRRGYWQQEAAAAEVRIEDLRAALSDELARRAFCLDKLGFFAGPDDAA